jgi:uncharacterized protein YjiK
MWHLILVLLSWMACKPVGETSFAVYSPLADSLGYEFPFQLSEPDTTFFMPGALEEISGLSFGFQEKYLITHNDEKGILFLLDPARGTVEHEVYFRKDGDYEGVEMVGDDVFVVKNTGTVYQVKHLMTEGQETIKHGNFLNSDNDVEGLCYDSSHHRLLLACKGDAGLNDPTQKAIYAFDLDSLRLDSVPAFTISLEEIQRYLATGPELSKLEKLLEYFEEGSEELVFSPSAIAIHPHSKNLYLTSAIKDLLLVVNPEGQVLYLEKLKKTVHQQAEGLCFSTSGTLYISNEGKKGNPPTLHRFSSRRESIDMGEAPKE